MKKLALIVAGALALACGIAQAQSDSAKPLAHATESLDKNLQKHPDNKGLQNARQRLEDNQNRFEDRRMDRSERMADRPDRPQRPEAAGHR